MKQFTFLFFVVIFLSCNTSQKQTILNDLYSLGDGENSLARMEYEFNRLKNPYSNQVPSDIHLKEFAFLQSLPNFKSSSLQWQERGPYNVGGRTRALALDILNEDRILAGGVSGGLWISEDGGLSFDKVTTNVMLHSITSIAQDTRLGFENVWYYGTGELSGNSADLPGHGIYKSIDSGLSWTLLSTTFNDSAQQISNFGDFKYVQDVKVNPINGHVIAATFAGIFLSIDMGATWNSVLEADASPNGFSYLNFGNQTSVDIDINGVYYACLSSEAVDKGIWRSEDGLTWTSITPSGFSNAYRRIELTVNPLNTDELLFIVDASTSPFLDKHELWKYEYISGNGSGTGGSWANRTANLPDGDCLGFYDFNFGYYQSQNSYDMVIQYHPTEPDLVFLGGTNLYRSTDAFQSASNYAWIGGYQCDAVNPSNYVWPNHHPDNHAVAFLPSNPNVMISAHDGGLSKTNNCKAATILWENLNNGYGTSQFYTVAIEQGEVDNAMIIGGLQDNGTWHTNNLNPLLPWRSTFYGDGAYCAIAENRDAYYVSWQGGKVFKFDIEDNGDINGLTRIDPVGGADYLFINPFILDPNESNTMYLTAGSYIWRNDSLDAIPLLNDEYNAISQGWERINQSTTITPLGSSNYISALNISKNNSDILYYGTINGVVYKLSGLLSGNIVKENIKKSNMPSGAYVSCIETNPFNENEIFVTYSNYEVKSIFHSIDGGLTWTNISGSLEENPDGSGAGPSINWFHLYQDDTDTFYLAGTTSGLFVCRTLDGENTIWEREAVDEIGNVPVTMITSRTFDKNIVVATHGAGIFSTKVIDVAINDLINKQDFFDVGFPYPNPSNGKISLEFNLLSSSKVSAKVFNLLGIQIEIIEQGLFTEGAHKLKWNTSNYAEGLYFVAISNGSQSVERKFLVKK